MSSDSSKLGLLMVDCDHFQPDDPRYLSAISEFKEAHAGKVQEIELRQKRPSQTILKVDFLFTTQDDIMAANQALTSILQRHGLHGVQHDEAAAAKAVEHSQRGGEYYSKGQFKRAAAEFRAAIDADPDTGGDYYNLGLALCGMKKYSEAIPNLQKGCNLDPELDHRVIFAAQAEARRREARSRWLKSQLRFGGPVILFIILLGYGCFSMLR